MNVRSGFEIDLGRERKRMRLANALGFEVRDARGRAIMHQRSNVGGETILSFVGTVRQKYHLVFRPAPGAAVGTEYKLRIRVGLGSEPPRDN